MDSLQSYKAEIPKIEMVESCGEWFVRVTEKDGHSYTRTFEHKDHAFSFAEGQMARLGLDEIMRI
jgi:hypothetical protein